MRNKFVFPQATYWVIKKLLKIRKYGLQVCLKIHINRLLINSLL
jgi:hypothetical protein